LQVTSSTFHARLGQVDRLEETTGIAGTQ